MHWLYSVFVICGLGMLSLAEGQTMKPVQRDAPYHAYLLTNKMEEGEYRRLLITHGPIEDLAGHDQQSWSPLPLDNMAMTFRTYKTDSLWNEPFRPVQKFGAVDGQGKTALIDGTEYGYVPCPLADVIRLLEKPTGTLPIARIDHPLRGAEQTAKAFRLLLLEQLKAEK